MSNWISVNDKLPEEKGAYIVYYRTGGMSSSYHYGIGRFDPDRAGSRKFTGEFDWTSATHWMPLPSPPTE